MVQGICTDPLGTDENLEESYVFGLAVCSIGFLFFSGALSKWNAHSTNMVR